MLARIRAGRDDAARPEDRVPRPALPLHLADRPLGGPRHPGAAGVDDPRARSRPRRRVSSRRRRARELGRFVVLTSPELEPGDAYPLGAEPLTVGRGAAGNDIALPGDEFSSTRHARFEPRRDGVYVEDIGSTNGTFVNGILLTREHRLDARRRRPDRRDLPTVRRMTRPLKLGQAAGETDTGRKRRRNEDAFVCAPPLFAVADGMGGAQAGEVASGLAAAALRESQVDAGGEARVAELVREANRRVHQRATSDAAASGMGTTMTVALVDPDGTVSLRARRRLARLPAARRQARAADRRPLARRRARPARRAVPGPGRGASPALGDHPRARHRSRRSPSTRSPSSREPGDVVLLCSDGLSSFVAERDDRADHHPLPLRPARRGARPDPCGQPRRRRGQHHRRPLRARRATGETDAEPDERTREYPSAARRRRDAPRRRRPLPGRRRHDRDAGRRAPTRPRRARASGRWRSS